MKKNIYKIKQKLKIHTLGCDEKILTCIWITMFSFWTTDQAQVVLTLLFLLVKKENRINSSTIHILWK